MAVLFFLFGAAAGILLAFTGIGFVQDSAALVATVFLSALLVVLILGLLLLILRKLIWRRLFGFAEVQIEDLATPLSQVAERAVAGDVPGATQSARDLVAVGFARYAWISTRRWLIASLTGLIAAMAALAGTALLFKQNQLIEAQSGLLTEQNLRIAEQTLLLQQDVQLAEASRNAALAVAITEIAEDLGTVAEKVNAGLGQNGINVLDPARDLPRGLILRATSLSRALKPYRYLDTGLRAGDDTDATRIAMQRRRGDLAENYAKMAANFGWEEPLTQSRLTDRVQSPERGQLLSTLVQGGVRNLEELNAVGLDMTHASLVEAELVLVTAQMGRFDWADLTGAYLTQVDFRAAQLENARFLRAVIVGSDFGQLEAAAVRAPYRGTDAPFLAQMTGADFQGAVLRDSRFIGAPLLAANFDGALLWGVDFSQAGLAAATFRNAVIVQANLTGAGLASADFQGAVVFGDDALQRMAAADPVGFKPENWRLEPMALADVMALPLIYAQMTEAEVAAAGPAFRIQALPVP